MGKFRGESAANARENLGKVFLEKKQIMVVHVMYLIGTTF